MSKEDTLCSIEFAIRLYGNAEARCKKGTRTWKKYHKEFIKAHERYKQVAQGA